MKEEKEAMFDIGDHARVYAGYGDPAIRGKTGKIDSARPIAGRPARRLHFDVPGNSSAMWFAIDELEEDRETKDAQQQP
jgi:hypothetical protein